MDKEKKTFELEDLRTKKKQLENEKNELEVNTNEVNYLTIFLILLFHTKYGEVLKSCLKKVHLLEISQKIVIRF